MPAAVTPRRTKGGQTIVELLVGITVTGIILAALTGLLFTVSDRFANWTDRLVGVTDGVDLASAVQADGHRYVVCQGGAGGQLHLCVPHTCAAAVTYDSRSTGAGWVVTRTDAAGTGRFVGRLPGQPQFTSTTGKVTVRWTGRDRNPRFLYVYLHPPAGACP